MPHFGSTSSRAIVECSTISENHATCDGSSDGEPKLTEHAALLDTQMYHGEQGRSTFDASHALVVVVSFFTGITATLAILALTGLGLPWSIGSPGGLTPVPISAVELGQVGDAAPAPTVKPESDKDSLPLHDPNIDPTQAPSTPKPPKATPNY